MFFGILIPLKISTIIKNLLTAFIVGIASGIGLALYLIN